MIGPLYSLHLLCMVKSRRCADGQYVNEHDFHSGLHWKEYRE